MEVKDCEQKAHNFGPKLKEKKIEALDRYVDGILATMPGNLYWSTICNRHSVIGELTTLVSTLLRCRARRIASLETHH